MNSETFSPIDQINKEGKPPANGPSEKKEWSALVREQATPEKLQGTTCAIYLTNANDVSGESTTCICGRSKRGHSFDGAPVITARVAQKWKPELHAKPVGAMYGQLASGARVSSYSAQK
jgi:hypothetical protein